MSADPARPEWITARERGTAGMLRIMTLISLHLGRPVARLVLYAITAYFFVFAPSPRRHMRIYLRHVLRRDPSLVDRFRLLLRFATSIHDRVYLLNGRLDLFDISLEGDDIVEARIDRGEGAVLMGAHLGSFEIIRAIGLKRPGLRVTMVAYQENAQKITGMLSGINPSLSADLISLGTCDSMLQVQSRLADGGFVGFLGDRAIGADTWQRVPFLGAPASFPTGAMRAAATLRCPVIFMAGLYRGTNRYQVVFEELADFSKTPRTERENAVRMAIDRYAAALERHCAIDPYNWFNFYDFWREPQCTRH